MTIKHLLIAATALSFAACSKNDNNDFFLNEDPASFAEIATLKIGGEAAAEISAYDPLTKRLFVVNNSAGNNRIDVIDLKDPAAPSFISSIGLSAYGGLVNSLAVHSGILAAAIESINKQENGKAVFFKTSDYTEVKQVTVGALPDMITYSPDGNYALTANEGEPSADYLNDPEGTVSIISIKNNYAVVTLNFAGFAEQLPTLKAKGLRIFGPNASFAKDMEPEYITVAEDSKTAWVTLQENNAIAKINLNNKTISDLFPLGFKNYNTDENAIDVSDKDGGASLAKWNIKGIYQPDAIAVFHQGGIPYLFTANEGDVREYAAFEEAKRVKSMNLDPVAFPNATELKKDEVLGRLNVTTTLGAPTKDGPFTELYSFGARSFSVWNGNTGAQVFDSKNELERKCIATPGFYDDTRSDDKGVEPEGITIGKVGNTQLAFVGMERADAVAVYTISAPTAPVFIKLLKTGDAPEGVLFISAKDSPSKQSLLIVSSEGDGTIKIFRPKTL